MTRRQILALTLAGGAGALLTRGGRAAGLHPRAREILDAQRADWESAPGTPAALAAMRDINWEWDFMARTFLILALVERALAEPALAARHRAIIDRILEHTLAAEARGGQETFLMPYGRRGGWRGGGRSIFVDGEIALAMGARGLLGEDPWAGARRARIGRFLSDLEAAPRGLLESYPDEGWTFCHAMAFGALRLHDHLEGASHRARFESWLARARGDLIDPTTGLFVSGFTTHSPPSTSHGPEGSTIFLAATLLRLLDPALAEDQYRRAAAELGGSVLGMGYAREWPESWPGHVDVDSGPIVPVIDASPSASGFALLASRAFGDEAWHAQLVRALGAADAVIAVDPELKAMADNAVGEAVLLYAFSYGPMERALGAWG